MSHKCGRCKQPYNYCESTAREKDRFCSGTCQKYADDAYDEYVDPSGFYRNKAERNDPWD